MEPSGDKYGRKKEEVSYEPWNCSGNGRAGRLRSETWTVQNQKSLYNNEAMAALWIETAETKDTEETKR